MLRTLCYCFFFFFNDTATTEIYTLSLHDALPISFSSFLGAGWLSLATFSNAFIKRGKETGLTDRKSTRLNSSHTVISYAVFCLKKKSKKQDVIFWTGEQILD